MGAGGSVDAVKKASPEELKQAAANLSDAERQKLCEALAKAQPEKSSLVSSAAVADAPPSEEKSPLAVFTSGVETVEKFLENGEAFVRMFGELDADESGKVKISEMGYMADMMVRACDSLESKDDILKQFDKNGDGALSKDEWKDLVSEWCKANQKKMAQVILARGADAVGSDPAWPELKARLEKFA
ncbi:unnamed protein product [Effrenium voratum]|uniref:EF-hand domain-containing protein n=1 Tax=Effrenium voratum TaxID=2562239 RepID=A0AA36JFT9_9DINO|nr:unnamed protein product [Effrenium voratum]CAJ1404281.1 unnamed protein product [Effrenium voratum]CAJ1432785.1 unnamed protein product [Effrenium voratum]